MPAARAVLVKEFRQHRVPVGGDHGGVGALPFNAGAHRGVAEPLPYLNDLENRSSGVLDIPIGVWLQTPAMREAVQGPVRLTRGNAVEAACWTPARLLAYQPSVAATCSQAICWVLAQCRASVSTNQVGSLLELTLGGKQPITLPHGETRKFLADGDTLIMRGDCERTGARRIGLGACSGTVMAAPKLHG